jgi:hypothetical protein
MNMESMDELEAVMTPEALQALYAKTAYLLRESRKTLLKNYGVEDEAALLDRIKCGDASEHPAYDHYLSALIMEQTRMQVRADMLAKFGGVHGAEETPISVHLLLQDKLEAHYAHRLAEPIRMAQDALLLSFDNGLMMEVRYFSSEEYALNWCWGEAELRIDTAPTHPDCTTFPQHLHGEDGVVSADPVTRPGTECWVNFSRLLDLLLVNPLLGQA